MIHKRFSLLAAAALVAGLGVAMPAAVAEEVENDADTYRLLNLFGDAFERVRADYVERPSDQN